MSWFDWLNAKIEDFHVLGRFQRAGFRLVNSQCQDNCACLQSQNQVLMVDVSNGDIRQEKGVALS